MAEQNNYGPAFPVSMAVGPAGDVCNSAEAFKGAEGMSLRDWFAGQALAGMASIALDDGDMLMGWGDMSRAAYKAADSMLKARRDS